MKIQLEMYVKLELLQAAFQIKFVKVKSISI